MKAHINRQFIKEVEKVFSSFYPYLKLDFPKSGPTWLTAPAEDGDADKWRRQAEDILRDEVGLADGMTVGELELRLKELLGAPVVVLRRSGTFWIETSMTRNWTLKEQDDHGRELSGHH
jgi:hypothetical protein